MNVMLIDDNAMALRLLEIQTRAVCPDCVLTFQTAVEAMRILSVNPNATDLVICDLQRSGLDGIGVLRHLAELSFSGSIVLLTSENDQMVHLAEQFGLAHHLNILAGFRKPMTMKQCRQVLERSAAHKAQGTRPRPGMYSEDELRGGLTRGEFCNYYQPKVDLNTGALTGVEARWQHPVDGLVSPEHFMPLVEELGLIGWLTTIVLDAAFGQVSAWAEAGLDLTVAVNVSMDNLLDPSFPDQVAQSAKHHGVPPSSLVLEVTEGRIMRDRRAALDVLMRLRVHRIGLSIDDFGTGSSCLAQLRDMPFDELKIDRSIVCGAPHRPVLRAIVGASCRLGQKLGMRVVAEGVEDREDWDHMRNIGGDLAQGYFIARPMPPEAVLGWARGWVAPA